MPIVYCLHVLRTCKSLSVKHAKAVRLCLIPLQRHQNLPLTTSHLLKLELCIFNYAWFAFQNIVLFLSSSSIIMEHASRVPQQSPLFDLLSCLCPTFLLGEPVGILIRLGTSYFRFTRVSSRFTLCGQFRLMPEFGYNNL